MEQNALLQYSSSNRLESSLSDLLKQDSWCKKEGLNSKEYDLNTMYVTCPDVLLRASETSSILIAEIIGSGSNQLNTHPQFIPDIVPPIPYAECIPDIVPPIPYAKCSFGQDLGYDGDNSDDLGSLDLGSLESEWQRRLSPVAVKESAAVTLEELFPKAAIDFHSLHVFADKGSVAKVTDTTFTGVVFCCSINDQKVYGKISGNRDMLRKEAAYMRYAWDTGLMRPFTPQLFEYAESDTAAVLMTLDTETDFNIPTSQIRQYNLLFFQTLYAYANKNNLDDSDANNDPFMRDVFNLAVSHTLMKKHMSDPVFSRATLESVASDKKIYSWLDASNLAQEFKSLLPLYVAVAEEVAAYDTTPTILAHGDARQENRFGSWLGVRPLGDFGLAKPSTEEFDLGKIECSNPADYVGAYNFFRGTIESTQGNAGWTSPHATDAFKQRVNNVAFVNALRIGSFKMSRGLEDQAQRYVDLAKHYESLIKN